MLIVLVTITGVNLVVAVSGVFRFARWTGIVDTRLTNLEKRIASHGDENRPAAY